MSLLSIPLLRYPDPPSSITTSIGITGRVIDAVGESVAGIFCAPKTGTIAKIYWSTFTTTTGDTLDIRIETVNNSNGDPTGTLWSANTNGNTVVQSGDGQKGFLTTLITGANVNAGDLLAVNIVNGSVPGDMSISNLSSSTHSFPYTDLFAAAAWSHQTTPLLCGLEYSDGTYPPIPGLWGAFTAADIITFDSSSDPDEYGIYFSLPFTARIVGSWVLLDSDNPCDVLLYDTDGSTVLRRHSENANVRSNTSAGLKERAFTSPVTLIANQFYRLTILPTTTSDINFTQVTTLSPATMDTFSGGRNIHSTTRVNGGAWTQIQTIRPVMGVLIDAIDAYGAGVQIDI